MAIASIISGYLGLTVLAADEGDAPQIKLVSEDGLKCIKHDSETRECRQRCTRDGYVTTGNLIIDLANRIFGNKDSRCPDLSKATPGALTVEK